MAKKTFYTLNFEEPLNRSPLFPPQPKTVRTASGGAVTFPLNSEIELFAGKTKALLERVAVRDLYDVGGISTAYATLLCPRTVVRRLSRDAGRRAGRSGRRLEETEPRQNPMNYDTRRT
ncbi:MAG: nucleotidyl transferase AbiEii/AbiGii toxin family protein [Propionibacteriaceae bacterium]|nr:nucleotidyl transferase AbiEii/AbiGii toxin family protein [Propionibacteriaceae bacterium]